MRILVTGGAGYLGGHVINELLSHTPHVAVLDDFSTGSRANLLPAGQRGLDKRNIFVADVTSPEVGRILATWRPAIIVHLAAQSKVARSVTDPVADVMVNVGGTVNVLNAAAHYGVERVVIASSGGTVYGQAGSHGGLIGEDTRDAAPSPYGIGKAAADDYRRLFWELYGLRATSLAFGNVYGPDVAGGPGTGVVASFATRAVAGEPPQIHGDGRQTRDFVFIRDAAHAVTLACIYAPTCRINIASGVGTSLHQLLALVGQALCTTLRAEVQPPSRGEVYRIRLDNTRARLLLGWQPGVDLPTGIQHVINAARAARGPAA